ncbi:MAG: hypothetical protein AAFY82_01290 [Pseudomonadota bacterium]
MTKTVYALRDGGLAIMTGLIALTGCQSAAEFGDDAIRVGSYGHIQATPFMDAVQAKSCRDSLTQTLGFPRESRGMKNGVMVVQNFECKAEQVVAKVSLTNRSETAMYCFAETETDTSGVYLPPLGVGFFEYAFKHSAWQDCQTVS